MVFLGLANTSIRITSLFPMSLQYPSSLEEDQVDIIRCNKSHRILDDFLTSALALSLSAFGLYPE